MTKDWNFNEPLESKSENQEDPDKILFLFSIFSGSLSFSKVITFLSDGFLTM